MNRVAGSMEHSRVDPVFRGQPVPTSAPSFFPVTSYRQGVRMPTGVDVAPSSAASPVCIDDADWIGLIELTPALVNRIRKLKIRTVRQLCALTPALMITMFGRIKAIEIYRQIAAAGFRLTSNPSDEELWQFQFVNVAELSRPVDPTTALAALRPWLGVATDTLLANGVETLHALRYAAENDLLPAIPNLTPSAIERVRAFLRP